MLHQAVLLREVISLLDPQSGEDFIDATVGNGGHSKAILERTGPNGRLLGIDWDDLVLGGRTSVGGTTSSSSSISEGPRRDTGSMVWESEPPRTDSLNQRDRSGIALRPLEVRKSDFRLVLEQGNFAGIVKIARRAGFKQVSGVLFDLGLRSEQIDESRHGFSYLKNGPLDMRFNKSNRTDKTNRTNDLTAVDIVNEWPESELARVFKEYGEERNAKRIARAIAEARRYKKITTTAELVEIMNKTNMSNRTYSKNKTLARVFQALRIAVNNELENLSRGLAGAWSLLKPQGRLAVISFHSLEDRIVKNFFKDRARAGEGRILTPKPVRPSQAEIKGNPRSRSAKMRAVIKK